MYIYPSNNLPFSVSVEPAQRDRLDEACSRWPRFREEWEEGIVWMLQRGGFDKEAVKRGTENHTKYIYTYEGDALAGFPRVVIVYRYKKTTTLVIMLDISDPQ